MFYNLSISQEVEPTAEFGEILGPSRYFETSCIDFTRGGGGRGTIYCFNSVVSIYGLLWPLVM